MDIALGLLFLIRGPDIYQPLVWEHFFQIAGEHIEIFCHSKYPIARHSILNGHEIAEWRATEWGHISMVEAMYALLRAAVKDSRLSHFLFLSESCIPIKSWNFIYSDLTADGRSRIDWRAWDEMHSHHQQRHRRSIVPISTWRLHPQWVLLDRETAEFLLANADCVELFRNVICSDEHVFGTTLALQRYDMKRIKRSPVTWTSWREGNHPETFHSVSREMLMQWQNFDGYCARKVDASARISLAEILSGVADEHEIIRSRVNSRK